MNKDDENTGNEAPMFIDEAFQNPGTILTIPNREKSIHLALEYHRNNNLGVEDFILLCKKVNLLLDGK